MLQLNIVHVTALNDYLFFNQKAMFARQVCYAAYNCYSCTRVSDFAVGINCYP